jgi:hypothetical protein
MYQPRNRKKAPRPATVGNSQYNSTFILEFPP